MSSRLGVGSLGLWENELKKKKTITRSRNQRERERERERRVRDSPLVGTIRVLLV